MAKKRKISKKKIRKLIGLIIILIIIVITPFALKKFLKSEKKETKKNTVVETIAFDYVLHDNQTVYYKNLFNELKTLLNEKDYNEDDYAKLVAQLFITDLFTIDNKVTNNDIGGTQFVYSLYRNDFENLVKSTLYKYVESNIYDDRKQELPVVVRVGIDNITKDLFKYSNTSDPNAYYIDITINYEKDLGYPTKYKMVLIHNDKKIEVAKIGE